MHVVMQAQRIVTRGECTVHFTNDKKVFDFTALTNNNFHSVFVIINALICTKSVNACIMHIDIAKSAK